MEKLISAKKGGLREAKLGESPTGSGSQRSRISTETDKNFFGGNCTGESFPFVGDLLGVPHI